MVLIVFNATIGAIVMKVCLSVAEIANVTKKEKTTVLRWIKAGRFGNIRKVGNEYRVPHFSIVITLVKIEHLCYNSFPMKFSFHPQDHIEGY